MSRRLTTWRPAAGLAAGLLLVTMVFPAPLHAYIDPVSGSIILQVVAAGVLAATFTLKRFGQRIRDIVRMFWARVRNP